SARSSSSRPSVRCAANEHAATTRVLFRRRYLDASLGPRLPGRQGRLRKTELETHPVAEWRASALTMIRVLIVLVAIALWPSLAGAECSGAGCTWQTTYIEPSLLTDGAAITDLVNCT